MVSFFLCIGLLIAGYFVYGTLVEKVFQPDANRPTPAMANPDGIDYVPISTPRAFLVQLLNIAGLGPIFGAISGALWGPSVYLWIVGGTIFAGAVHDYLSGMLSVRNDGASISEITGKYLGPVMMTVMRIFSVVLLVMVGVVFMVGPAGLLALLTPEWLNVKVWTVIILVYYFLATLLPVDKVIARFYPIFGLFLILMAVGVSVATMINNGVRPMMEITLENLYPAATQKPIWPLMFITVACGAISGFHATQSPMMARCLKDERLARPVFYGAMVSEGFIALVWAAAGVTFYESTGGLGAVLASAGPGGVVYDICVGFLGPVGAALALLGVVACPITSGDTAFRSARLTIADWLGLDQKSTSKRLALAVPILGIGAALTQMDFSIIWRYFSWTNQTLAMIVLWTGSVYLYRTFRGKIYYIIGMIPATFMSAVTVTYILQAKEGFGLSTDVTYPVGIAAAALFLFLFLRTTVLRHE